MPRNKKNLVILGSTGSIGLQTLDIVRRFPDKFRIVGLAGGSNITLLKQQIDEFQPVFYYSQNSSQLSTSAKVISMEEMAKAKDIDLVVVATAGKAGLLPSLSAIKSHRNIAIANKEVLVMAGHIVTKMAKKYKIEIIPVDSEHSAIWQCLRGENNPVKRIILTASGGPFYKYDNSRMSDVTVEETLNHPTWKMGKKVTVDSATLMNKGLEKIEAHWLFNSPYDSIDIVIHRQSVIHSLVEFIDGSAKAQLSYPDMHYPIQYALTYPERYYNPELKYLDLPEIGSLNFEPVDYNRFPCLSLALQAGKKEDTYPVVLCAADEIAVELFLNGLIKFTSIAGIISDVLDKHQPVANPDIDDIMAADIWARDMAKQSAHKRFQ
jgi:1-deoxy-D-xylulose-5-phosphate reductoisomerase